MLRRVTETYSISGARHCCKYVEESIQNLTRAPFIRAGMRQGYDVDRSLNEGARKFKWAFMGCLSDCSRTLDAACQVTLELNMFDTNREARDWFSQLPYEEQRVMPYDDKRALAFNQELDVGTRPPMSLIRLKNVRVLS